MEIRKDYEKEFKIKELKKTIKSLQKENKQLKNKIEDNQMIKEINADFEISAIEKYYKYLHDSELSADYTQNFISYKYKLRKN